MATKSSKTEKSPSTGRYVVKKSGKSKDSITVGTNARSTAIMDRATKKYHSALRNLAKK